jgi:hypothetical protein
VRQNLRRQDGGACEVQSAIGQQGGGNIRRWKNTSGIAVPQFQLAKRAVVREVVVQRRGGEPGETDSQFFYHRMVVDRCQEPLSFLFRKDAT